MSEQSCGISFSHIMTLTFNMSEIKIICPVWMNPKAIQTINSPKPIILLKLN